MFFVEYFNIDNAIFGLYANCKGKLLLMLTECYLRLNEYIISYTLRELNNYKIEDILYIFFDTNDHLKTSDEYFSCLFLYSKGKKKGQDIPLIFYEEDKK